MQLAAQLSPRSRSKVASIFHEHDRDKEGSLDTMELRAAVERMGYRPSEEQLVALTKEFDFDDSSALDLLEFTALMSRLLGYRELPSEQIALLRKVRPTHPTIPRPRTWCFSPDGTPIGSCVPTPHLAFTALCLTEPQCTAMPTPALLPRRKATAPVAP